MGKDRDQLVLELVAGRISLLFDLGSGPAKLMSNGENYNDGKWHLVEVDRMEKTAKLEVDGTDKVRESSKRKLARRKMIAINWHFLLIRWRANHRARCSR